MGVPNVWSCNRTCDFACLWQGCPSVPWVWVWAVHPCVSTHGEVSLYHIRMQNYSWGLWLLGGLTWPCTEAAAGKKISDAAGEVITAPTVQDPRAWGSQRGRAASTRHGRAVAEDDEEQNKWISLPCSTWDWAGLKSVIHYEVFSLLIK